MKRIVSSVLAAVLLAGAVFSLASCEEETVEPKQSYTITYVLNGGVNSKDNPTSYTKKDKIVLQDAEYKRLEFVGWFENEQCEGEPITVIENSTGDKTLYAKYDGPKVFFYTDQREPVTLFGKEISVSYTNEMAVKYDLLFEKILKDIEEGKLSYEEIDAEVQEYYDAEPMIMKEYRIADILACASGEAEDYALENEIYALLSSLYPNYDKIDVAFASSVYRKDFYEGKTDEEIEEYVSTLDPVLAEQISSLDVKMSDVVNSYYSGEIEPYDAIVEYSALAKEYAKLQGYESYLDYSYENEYFRDYTANDTGKLKEYILSYVIPFYQQANEKCSEYYGALSKEEKAELESLFSDFYAYHLDYFDRYAEKLGEDYLENYKAYFTSGNYFYSAVKNDNITAFVWNYDNKDNIPYMFMSGEFQELSTFIHEFGHYNAMLTGGGADDASYDIAETQSQGNELMFYQYLVDEGLVSTKVGKAFYAYHVSNMLSSVFDGYLCNEMEKYLYTTDLTEVSKTEFVAKWNEICSEVGLEEYQQYSDWMMQTLLGYRCYYISYATSALASLELSARANEDFDAAIESYRMIYREYPESEEMTFTKIIEGAGLYGVFSEEAYELITSISF